MFRYFTRPSGPITYTVRRLYPPASLLAYCFETRWSGSLSRRNGKPEAGGEATMRGDGISADPNQRYIRAEETVVLLAEGLHLGRASLREILGIKRHYDRLATIARQLIGGLDRSYAVAVGPRQREVRSSATHIRATQHDRFYGAVLLSEAEDAVAASKITSAVYARMPNRSYAGGESVLGDAPQRRIEVLGATTSGVCNFPGPIDDHHIRCGRDLVCPDARALVIVQRAKWRLVLLQITPNSGRRSGSPSR